MGNLLEMYERICELSDMNRQVVREVRRSQAWADHVKEQAMISGAMPGELGVVLRFRRHSGMLPQMVLTPELR